jgi:hypothetical protein
VPLTTACTVAAVVVKTIRWAQIPANCHPRLDHVESVLSEKDPVQQDQLQMKFTSRRGKASGRSIKTVTVIPMQSTSTPNGWPPTFCDRQIKHALMGDYALAKCQNKGRIGSSELPKWVQARIDPYCTLWRLLVVIYYTRDKT